MSFPIHAIFAHPDAGYEADQAKAAQYLTVGESYTLESLIVGRSSSTVYLMDFPGVSFNSVMFDADPEGLVS